MKIICTLMPLNADEQLSFYCYDESNDRHSRLSSANIYSIIHATHHGLLSKRWYHSRFTASGFSLYLRPDGQTSDIKKASDIEIECNVINP